MHLHVAIVYITVACQSDDKVWPRSRFILRSGSKKLSLLMEESTSSRFALIMQDYSCSLCDQLNCFVQGLQEHSEDSVISKDSILFDLVSVEDCEHFARSRLLLVRAWPKLNCSTKNVHLREAATGRTCGNLCRHHHVLHQHLEQTRLRLHTRLRWSQHVDVRCSVIRPNISHTFVRSWELSQCANEEPTRRREGQVVAVEVVVRRAQRKQVSKMVT